MQLQQSTCPRNDPQAVSRILSIMSDDVWIHGRGIEEGKKARSDEVRWKRRRKGGREESRR